MSSQAKKRKNGDGSCNLEGYSPFAARIHVNNIVRVALPGCPDGSLRRGPGPKIYLIYTPTLGICVLKQFVIPSPLSSLAPGPDSLDGDTRRQNWEIKYTSTIDNHPNILRFFGYAVADTEIQGLITEYMPLGSLATVVELEKQLDRNLCTTENITSWALQLARALAYCHEQKIVHRDIKPDNVLLSEDGKTIKLCDFGFARSISHEMTQNIGTPGYQAPEVIGSSNYTLKADVWSYGMFLYVMTHQKLPFGVVKNSHELRRRLQEGIRPEVTPNPAFDLLYCVMRQCWQTTPDDRPTMVGIVNLLDPMADGLTPGSHMGNVS